MTEKIVGFVVESYPTLRSPSEPILPRIWSYRVIHKDEIEPFINERFEFDPNKCFGTFTTLDKAISIAFLYGKMKHPSLFTTDTEVNAVKGLDYYTKKIYLHIKAYGLYTAEEISDDKLKSIFAEHELHKMSFDTDVDHYAHNECGPVIIARPIGIIIEQLTDLGGGFFTSDRYDTKLF